MELIEPTYIEILCKVEYSFLTDIRRKVVFAEHYDEHREFWIRELTEDLERCREEGLLLREIDARGFAEQLLGTILELRLNHTNRDGIRLFCKIILRGAATREGIELIDRRR